MVSFSDPKKRVLAILCLAQFGAMLVWYNFSAVLPILQQEWRLNNDQSGTILSAFQLGYVLSVLFTGWLADRIGGRLIFALCAVETGIAGIGFAFFASDYSSALVWRALAGIGQGGLYVPGIQLLSRWYPVGQRGMALGVYTCSLMAAYAAAYLVAAPLATAFSWQTAVFWTSIWALPAALLVFNYIPDQGDKPAVPASLMNPRETTRPEPAWKRQVLWWIILGYAGHMWELYAFNGWIGVYATQVLKNSGLNSEMSLTYGGIIAAACLLMGVVSPALAGWLSDIRGRCFTATVVLTLSGFGSLLFGWLADSSPGVMIPAGLLYSFMIVADSAIFKAGLTEMVPPEQIGSSLSLQSVLGFGVTIISPKLFGITLDSFGWGWAFSMLAIGPVVGILAMQRLRRLPESVCMAGGKR